MFVTSIGIVLARADDSPALQYAMVHIVAGVNGGFLKVKEFEPRGLHISNGERTGAFENDRWIKGVIQVRDGQLSLLHRDDFEDSEAITQLIQTGPWLVRNYLGLYRRK